MASTSSVQRSFKYDVFLSFIGEDTRKNFVDHLYHALCYKGIITYKHDEKIEKGEKISEQLIRSIEDSKIHFIVFSKNYANSSRCLNELVKIIKCQQRTSEQTAYPIFYDVEPTEVRNQSGTVEKAFAKHVEKEDPRRWKDALKRATDLAGWELKSTVDGQEAKFIQKIVQDIILNPYFTFPSIDMKLVGMETRVNHVVSDLELHMDVVHMIGIWGMGGGGKTTLARAVFDSIRFSFEGFSFVENVREVSKGPGLKKLQKQILRDVFDDRSINVKSAPDGKDMMKKMMGSRKVLIVLDDVDAIEQLKALAGEPNWFKPGSRIIITTRDKQVLVAHKVDIIDVSLLSPKEAICLFSRRAFRTKFPSQGYEELSRKVISYAAGLPLTIRVLGSFLKGRSELEWEDAIERLVKMPLEVLLQKLELSYDGLDDDCKEIFLEVACMLKGEEKDVAIRILEGCGFKAHIGLGVLEEKSLLTISGSNTLQLHNQIEEMGRDIVRRVSIEPNKHSRLWVREEVKYILENKLGTKAIRSMKLENLNIHPTTIMEGLKKMEGLRNLYVDERNSIWDIDQTNYKCQYLPDSLRSLRWVLYPSWCLPKTFEANMLVNLEMPCSNISQLWEGDEIKVLNKLRFLNLSGSKLSNLDLGMTPNLEQLFLRECDYFKELRISVVCRKLKSLFLGCPNLTNLNLEMFPNLEELYLEGCSDSLERHLPLEIRKLTLSNKEIKRLPNSICMLKHLKYLELKSCFLLEQLPQDLDQFECLEELHLTDCISVRDIPSSITKMKCLKFLILGCPKLTNLNLELIPNLEELYLEECNDSIELHLPIKLLKLTFSSKEIKHLPNNICMLKHLKFLELKSCFLLEQLPHDLDRLECLEELYLTNCISLRDIPSSICKMECLKYLHLPYCMLVKKLPEDLGRLKCLKELNIEGAGVRHLPQTILQLKEGLHIVGSTGRLKSYGLTSLQEISSYTASCDIGADS